MSEPRTFYGGEPLTGTKNVGGDRHYNGQTPSIGIWKCPSCRTENEGAFEQGCVHCGAGKPGFHVGTPPPVVVVSGASRGQLDKIAKSHPDLRLEPGLYPPVQVKPSEQVQNLAIAWTDVHPDASLDEAFIAGYQLAQEQLTAHTMKAAPVTVDVETLAPEGKSRRTIVAALKLFRDQVLTQTPDEIESGEWCSPEEADQLISQLETDQ